MYLGRIRGQSVSPVLQGPTLRLRELALKVTARSALSVTTVLKAPLLPHVALLAPTAKPRALTTIFPASSGHFALIPLYNWLVVQDFTAPAGPQHLFPVRLDGFVTEYLQRCVHLECTLNPMCVLTVKLASAVLRV